MLDKSVLSVKSSPGKEWWLLEYSDCNNTVGVSEPQWGSSTEGMYSWAGTFSMKHIPGTQGGKTGKHKEVIY